MIEHTGRATGRTTRAIVASMCANLRGFRAEIIKDHYVLELEQAEKEHQQLVTDAARINDLLAKHHGKLQLRVIAGGHTYQVRGK